MSEPKLSKYAAKVAARKANESASIALNVIARIERGECVQPKPTPQPKKPKQQPPPPRNQRNDLGDRPERLAALFRDASAALHGAADLADEILEMANPGIQRAEPLAITQFLVALLPRIDGMVVRAGRILNKKGEA